MQHCDQDSLGGEELDHIPTKEPAWGSRYLTVGSTSGFACKHPDPGLPQDLFLFRQQPNDCLVAQEETPAI